MESDDDMTAKTYFTAYHFLQANPEDDPNQGSIPLLLRRVADTIEEYGDIQVNDILLRTEITDNGDLRPSLKVYYNERSTEDS